MISVLKPILKAILPKRIVEYLALVRRGEYELRQYWSGVYQRFSDVPASGNGYFSEALTKQAQKVMQEAIVKLSTDWPVPYHLEEENSYLPLVASLVRKSNDKFNILELGGGMGIGYLSMLACLENPGVLTYSIIDTPPVCEAGRALFKEDNRIQFHSDFPNDLDNVDIAFVKSSLQYFEDYESVLKKLASYNPEFIFFVKFAAGNNVTYVTAQRNLSGTVIPFLFLNLDTIREIMASLGYAPIYRSVLDRYYNQDNFSKDHQVRKYCNILFRRTEVPVGNTVRSSS